MRHTISDQLGTWTLRELRALVDELADAVGLVHPRLLARARLRGAEAAIEAVEKEMDDALADYVRLHELEAAARGRRDPGAATLREKVSTAGALWVRLKARKDSLQLARDKREAEWRALL